MSCSLADFSTLPNSSQVPICLIEGKVQYSAPEFSNVHIYTPLLSSHPHIEITNELLHPSLSAEDSNRIFLPVSQNLWKKLQHTWYEKGFTATLELAANHKENQGFLVLGFAAKQLLSTSKFLASLYNHIPGYKKREGGDILISRLSQNPLYSTSNIRNLAWHPHCTKLAVAASDDSVRIYSDNSQLVPLLKCRNQHLISCLAWRPLCTSELAVGCAVGVVLWHVDPSSVITRPSSSHTQVLTRPGHTHISSLAWSPQGDLLVTGSVTDDTMYVWATGLDKAVPLKRVGGGGISCITWSPDSMKVFAATTNLIFRMWETCQWEPDRWLLSSGRVVSAVWSATSSLVLFATSVEPVVYALACKCDSNIFVSESNRTAIPFIDVTAVELNSDERIGGEVASLAWDNTGHCLAISFRESAIIAVFMTSMTPSLNASPCCCIRGVGSESPAVIKFQDNFKGGANLTIGWSSGRVQYFPIVFTDLGLNQSQLQDVSHNLPNLSSYNMTSLHN